MGQSPSSAVSSPDRNRREIFLNTNRFGYGDADISDDSITGRDYTSDIPDECLAGIFQFLGSTDRKSCSVVCRRWLRVDGESRHRLSLNAQAEVLDFVPSLFARFDSVTKLALRCDRRSTSINDDALILISLRCKSLVRLKLRGCREVTEIGMAGLGKNCKNLKKLSCGSCTFGAKGVYAAIDHCTVLEELSVKRLRGVEDGVTELMGPAVASSSSSSLKSICLKELVNGQSFAPLIIGSKKLRTLKLIRCLGDWDMTLEMVGKLNSGLVEIHLEKVQVSDMGLAGISKCLSLETLHLVKTPECSDLGVSDVAERCKMLKKLHIDGWRTNRIGDDGLVSIAKQCPNLQELVLIAMYPTSLSLAAIASSCQSLERFALCGITTVGDAEIECIAAKCVALKKLCIKGCPVSNVGIAAFASGCPNLVKLKVRKCRNVTGEVVEWLRERRSSLAFNFDRSEVEALDSSGSEGGAQESTIAFPLIDTTQVTLVDDIDAPSSSNNNNNNNNRFSMLRTKFGFLAGRSFVPCALRRWANIDNISTGNFS
ncbi:F-box protein SKIP2-like [Gastrolobium bilobum]|uniref:F-box protein SKIP2-like n=1 Tax=Gastrolobium bilobum TaxID=150636 RepID=UPI002AB1F8EC|nr:F-box protein SKIP2-like [Gastrolobium bilobum]